MSNLPTPSLMRRVAAESVGTFWLILAGCGTAVLAATSTTAPDSPALFVGVGYVGVALAFGLAVATMAYGLGHISGGHFNPAVSLGLAVAGRLSWRDLPAYVLAQLSGAILGAGVLFVIASGRAGFDELRHQRLRRQFATAVLNDVGPGCRTRVHRGLCHRHPRSH